MESENNIKNLASKMVKIMQAVKHIQKTGYNSFHKYKYASESDVALAFGAALADHNVFMFTSILDRSCQSYQTRANKSAFLVTVKMQITFVDAESGESMSSIFYGDGTDADDKAVYKAITGCQKYALLKTFMVSTGDDPDQVSSSEPAAHPPGGGGSAGATDAQLKYLRVLMSSHEDSSTLTAKWLSAAGVKRFEDMPKMVVAKCINFLKEGVEE